MRLFQGLFFVVAALLAGKYPRENPLWCGGVARRSRVIMSSSNVELNVRLLPVEYGVYSFQRSNRVKVIQTARGEAHTDTGKSA